MFELGQKRKNQQDIFTVQVPNISYHIILCKQENVHGLTHIGPRQSMLRTSKFMLNITGVNHIRTLTLQFPRMIALLCIIFAKSNICHDYKTNCWILEKPGNSWKIQEKREQDKNSIFWLDILVLSSFNVFVAQTYFYF